MAERKKIIIDTDPGIDDAMAIFLALQSPEVEVIGLTTIYGNVYTTLATRNALHLLEIAGRTDIPVAEGSHVTITKGTKLRIADFVHGTDGLGNQNFPPPKGKPIKQSAVDFLIEQASLYPGKVTVVALGPLTNIALAIQSDPSFVKNVGQIVLLGGAFSVNGNVNPAAEANIFGDPEAADLVFTSGADILAIGINVTHQVVLTDADRDKLAESNGKYAQYICKILDVYFSYHHDAYSTKGVYLHDPTTILAAVDSSLVTYVEGVVRVQTVGITRGLTLFYNKQKRFEEVTEWSDKPTVKVAVTVDAPAVVKLFETGKGKYNEEKFKNTLGLSSPRGSKMSSRPSSVTNWTMDNGSIDDSPLWLIRSDVRSIRPNVSPVSQFGRDIRPV
ncbi:probable uridine nucleosidase 2 [Phtheirospermum japonicum]|uniref:Inosine nucleosidase n=1 Tax=Phtheirospermum japonicum TaxID=374723 RepID=A0A830BNG3_9LAMI|nr:probable uridine nucleosidase 2 [Phtheirospermum japonicum]